jgi:hypothetical protein
MSATCHWHCWLYIAYWERACKTLSKQHVADVRPNVHSACVFVFSVQITVKNNIPANAWPSLFEGLSIHWHGFSMKGYAWMDGTKYVSQCPIERGSSFTYKFQVRLPVNLWQHHGGQHGCLSTAVADRVSMPI